MLKVFPFHRDFSPGPVELLTFYQLSACPDVQLGLLNHHFCSEFSPDPSPARTLHRCCSVPAQILESSGLHFCSFVKFSAPVL